jgi:hypothetical protein
MRPWHPWSQPSLTPSQMQDLRLVASKMTGAARRTFQAEMALQYCRGSARLTETILGWSREAVEMGLGAHRTGIFCVGTPSACSGRKRWEEHAPEWRCDSWPQRPRSKTRLFAQRSRLRASRPRVL